MGGANGWASLKLYFIEEAWTEGGATTVGATIGGFLRMKAKMDPSFFLDASRALFAFVSTQTLDPRWRFSRLADPPGPHLMRVLQSGHVA